MKILFFLCFLFFFPILSIAGFAGVVESTDKEEGGQEGKTKSGELRKRIVRQGAIDLSRPREDQLKLVPVKSSGSTPSDNKKKAELEFKVSAFLLDLADPQKSAFLRNCTSRQHVKEMVDFYVDNKYFLYILSQLKKEPLIQFVEYGAFLCKDKGLQTIKRDFISLAKRIEDGYSPLGEKARLALKGVSNRDSHALKVGVGFGFSYLDQFLQGLSAEGLGRARISELLFEYCNHIYINVNFYGRDKVSFLNKTLNSFFPTSYAVTVLVTTFGMLGRPLFQQLALDGGSGLLGFIKSHCCGKCKKGTSETALTTADKTGFAKLASEMNDEDIDAVYKCFLECSDEVLNAYLGRIINDSYRQELVSILVNLQRIDPVVSKAIIGVVDLSSVDLTSSTLDTLDKAVSGIGSKIKVSCKRVLQDVALDQMEVSYSIRRDQVTRQVLKKYKKNYCYMGRCQIFSILTWVLLVAGIDAFNMFLELMFSESTVEIPAVWGQECRDFNFSVPIEDRIAQFGDQTYEFEGDIIGLNVNSRIQLLTFLFTLVVNFSGTYGIPYALQKDVERQVDEILKKEGWDLDSLTYEEKRDEEEGNKVDDDGKVNELFDNDEDAEQNQKSDSFAIDIEATHENDDRHSDSQIDVSPEQRADDYNVTTATKL